MDRVGEVGEDKKKQKKTEAFDGSLRFLGQLEKSICSFFLVLEFGWLNIMF